MTAESISWVAQRAQDMLSGHLHTARFQRDLL